MGGISAGVKGVTAPVVSHLGYACGQITSLAFWILDRSTWGGRGARKRKDPNGGAAKRMFLKVTSVSFYDYRIRIICELGINTWDKWVKVVVNESHHHTLA